MTAPPARRTHHCRRCSRETPQILVGSENGDRPRADTYRCSVCGLALLSLGVGPGNVPDAEGLCRHILAEAIRVHGDARVKALAEDALAHLQLSIWILWGAFDAARGVTFRSYATGLLRHRLDDWYRKHVHDDRPGRLPDPLAVAVSLDAASGRAGDDGAEAGPLLDRIAAGDGAVASSLGSIARDPSESRSPDLARALASRGRGIAEQERALGLGSAA